VNDVERAPSATTGRAVRAVALVLGVIAVLGFAAWVAFGGRGGGGTEHRFVIPVGTGAEIDAGRPVEILPAQLDVRVDDLLVIVNDDDRAHVVGPFTVRAGETLRQTFTEPGRFVGACSVHPSGELAIVVR
jgi:hypothetical protein